MIAFASPFKYVLFCLTLCISIFCFYNPIVTLDTIFYVASAQNILDPGIQVLHEKTYSDIKNYVSDDQYSQLTNGNSFRYLVFQDHQSFSQILNFYEARVFLSI